ncbi:MAG: CopD family protein [Sinobacteraceae bacterium]|nr:CopD family protein [Nevskiaceae bacterium]
MTIPDSPDALSLAFRAVSFVLLLNAAGIPIFLAVFGRGSFGFSPDCAAVIARVGWKLAIAALLFVTGHYVLEAARMAGEMSGVLDPAMQSMALHSSQGTAFVVRMAGLVLIAASLPLAGPRIALLGSVLAIASFTLTGHTSVNPYRPAAAALLTLHLLVVAFWMGSLWPLYLAADREPHGDAARLIDAFSRIGAWLVPIIFVAGLALTALLVPSLSTFEQPYGQLLLAKVAIFAVLMALATLNKWRFGPACEVGDTRAFKRTVVLEYALICLVLAITATMTMFYSPDSPEVP